MSYRNIRPKKLTNQLYWVPLLLCGMGLIFLVVGIIGGIGFQNLSLPFFLNLFGGIFSLLGAGLLIGGGIGLYRMLKRKKRYQSLKETVIPRWLPIMDIQPNPLITINGEHPYIVRAQLVTEEGKIVLFKSETLSYDPSPYLKENQVKVYVHPADPTNYYVDIEGSFPFEVYEL